MQLRKYKYDVTRATSPASLARLLKRCKLEPGQKPLGDPKVCGLPLTKSDKARDISDQFAFECIGDIGVIFGLNLRTNIPTPKDFEIYCPSSTRPLVALYPEHLLPQAEDAFDLYRHSKLHELGVYLDAHLQFLAQARKFRRDSGRGLVYASSGASLFVFIQVGLEDIEYSRWRTLPRSKYIDACINDRAVTYLLGKIVQLSLLRKGFEDEFAVNIGALSEVAYGPLPLARLGEFGIMHPELFYQVTSESGADNDADIMLIKRTVITRTALDMANRLCVDGSGVNLHSLIDVDNILKEVRRLVQNVESLYVQEEPKIQVEPPRVAVPVWKPASAPIQLKPLFDSFCSHCNVVFRIPREQLYRDLYDLATRNELQSFLNSDPWAIRSLLTRYKEDLQTRGHDVGAIFLDLFINRFREQFTSGPEQLLTALYLVSGQKTIDYLMENPSGLARVIQENRAALESKYFDVDFVMQELREKRERVVRLVG